MEISAERQKQRDNFIGSLKFFKKSHFFSFEEIVFSGIVSVGNDNFGNPEDEKFANLCDY